MSATSLSLQDTHSWPAPRQDGATIGVKFPDGTENVARWSDAVEDWQVRYGIEWKLMRFAHGARDPVVWWPLPDLP
jgi:hypothetical protein